VDVQGYNAVNTVFWKAWYFARVMEAKIKNKKAKLIFKSRVQSGFNRTLAEMI
jgi:hypothetical protein